jgi:hypothetical protein
VTTALTVFLLLFATLAGQSIEPVLIYPMYGLWGLAWVWALLKRGQIGGPALLCLTAVMVSVAVNGVPNIFGYRRAATVLGYMGTYYFLQVQRPNLDRGLAIAGTLMSLLAVGGVIIGNQNVVSGLILMTVPASLTAWPDWGRRGYGLAAGAVALAVLGSRGAWLALAVALIVYAKRYWMLGLAPALAWLLVWIRPVTIAERVNVWRQALPDLSFFGRGFGSALYPRIDGTETFLHAHCVPLTMGVEAGLPALATITWMVWRLVPRLGRGWQGAALAGLLAWSLVDDVIFSWGPGLAAVYLIAEVMRDAD